MSDKTLVLEEQINTDDGSILLLTLNRADQRNPFDSATVARLREIVDGALAARTRVIILTGAGPAFSAGGDMKGYLSLYRDPRAFHQFQEDLWDLCNKLEHESVFTVAMVNGTCVAGGLEVALACDMIVMADDAKIGDAHLRFGQLPGAGGSQRLCRAVGVQRAKEMLLTGRLYTADEALAIGLVTQVAPREELRARTVELARTVAAYSPLGIMEMKRLIRIAQEEPLSSGLRSELELVWRYATTSYDAMEGLLAFSEKRRPQFEGR